MAQIIKVEAGDILVLANLGSAAAEFEYFESVRQGLTWLKEHLQLGSILMFEGDVDLSVLPAGWTPDAVARM